MRYEPSEVPASLFIDRSSVERSSRQKASRAAVGEDRSRPLVAGVLYRIAGVDPEIMAGCPGIDRLWGIHLGLSLLIGFIFVFSLSYYSLTYLLDYEPARLFIAALIASIVFMFDRALFQSDWFYMGLVRQMREAWRFQPSSQAGHESRIVAVARYVGRIILRLGVSLLVAYTLSIFVELAMFNDAISERIESRFQAENAPFFSALQQTRQALDAQITELYDRLRRFNREVDTREGRDHIVMSGDDKLSYENDWAKVKENEAQINALSAQIKANEREARELSDDIDAEIHGAKLKPEHTGKPTCGPVCLTKKGMLENVKAENTALGSQRLELVRRNQEFDAHAKATEEKYERADKVFLDEHRREIDVLQAQIAAREKARESDLQSAERQLKQSGLFRERRDDPVVRVRLLNELKSDPERGDVVSQLALMIQLFIMFLELTPIVGKMFFSPPSAYAWEIRAQVGIMQMAALERMTAAVEAQDRCKMIARGQGEGEERRDQAKELVWEGRGKQELGQLKPGPVLV